MKKNTKLIMSLIVVVIIFILLFAIFIVNKKERQKTNGNNEITEQQRSIYEQIKQVKMSLKNPNSFQLYQVSIYSLTKEDMENINKEQREKGLKELGTNAEQWGFNVLIDYSGENSLGGTTRTYYVMKFTNNDNDFNSDIKFVKGTHYEDITNAKKEIQSTAYFSPRPTQEIEKLDVKQIMEYIK